jgi:hypothetical protein
MVLKKKNAAPAPSMLSAKVSAYSTNAAEDFRSTTKPVASNVKKQVSIGSAGSFFTSASRIATALSSAISTAAAYLGKSAGQNTKKPTAATQRRRIIIVFARNADKRNGKRRADTGHDASCKQKSRQKIRARLQKSLRFLLAHRFLQLLPLFFNRFHLYTSQINSGNNYSF